MMRQFAYIRIYGDGAPLICPRGPRGHTTWGRVWRSRVGHYEIMYILVLFVPLLSAVISGLFGRRIGTRGAGILTSSCIVISAIISCFIFYETTLDVSPVYIKLWR